MKAICRLTAIAALALANCAAALDSSPPAASRPAGDAVKQRGLIIRKSGASEYDHVVVQGGFRIFFTADGGPGSPKDLSDKNLDGVPDYIESLLDKLQNARHILAERLHLKDPLAEGRLYDKGARYIDIYIKDIPKKYGIASGIVSTREPDILAGTNFRGPAISIILHRNLVPNTATPMHELFHLFQFNYSEFYNRWFSEGLGRWSQSLVSDSPVKEERLPSTITELDALLNKSHKAEYFWNRLSSLCDPANAASPVEYGSARVLADKLRPGTRLIKAMLDNTEKQYNLVRAQQKSGNTAEDYWPKEQTRLPTNNIYLLQAIKDSMQTCPQAEDEELQAFIELLSAAPLTACGGNQAPAVADAANRVERLGNPFLSIYKDPQRTYARNIWDMQAFDGALFLGAGNSSNIGPAQNAGPVPIVVYDPKTQSFRQEEKVDEEQIDGFRILNGDLYIPGHDPTQSWDWGNFYRRETGGAWKKYRNLPGVLHAYDLAWHGGKLFSASSTKQGAAVGISEDQGKTWSLLPLGRTRVYAMLKAAGKLYAVKPLLGTSARKKPSGAASPENHSVYEFVPPANFAPRQDIGRGTLFPETDLPPGQALKVTRALNLGETAFYIGAYVHNDHQSVPFGVYAAYSLEQGHPNVKRLPLPKDSKPWDLLLNDNYLYILTAKQYGSSFVIRVFRSPASDLAACSEVFRFTGKTFARSFEMLDGDFYFGLGGEIENPKRWRQEELSPETGQILRLRNPWRNYFHSLPVVGYGKSFGRRNEISSVAVNTKPPNTHIAATGLALSDAA
jgi:hypothetical protein